jgi:transposase
MLMVAVMIGVDPHKGSHTAVAIGAAEEPLAEVRVRAPAGQAGHLVAWAAGWPDRTWAVGGAAGLGHLLARQLVAAGEQVLDVQPKLASRVRLLQAGDTNKNDPNDALSVAVAALRSRTRREVTADDYRAVLKVWSKRHRDLARLRNQVACRLHAVLCDLVPGGHPKQTSAAQAARLLERASPSGAVALARAELAAEFIEDMRRLDAQLAGTRKRLAAAVKASGTTLTGVFGVGPVNAGTIIGDIAGVSRFPGRAQFASYNGTAPVEVSSGNRKIHRLSLRGSRRINHAIHMAAITPDPAPAQRRQEVLRAESSRGKDAQRSAPVPQAPDQRHHLRLPPGRRQARPGNHRERPGRATGERLCIQRGQLTPRTPALRTSHSRTHHHHTTRQHGTHTFTAKADPRENSGNHLTKTSKRTRSAWLRRARHPNTGECRWIDLRSPVRRARGRRADCSCADELRSRADRVGAVGPEGPR